MMVESRFFGGLEVVEIAGLLDVSEATVLATGGRRARGWARAAPLAVRGVARRPEDR
jgi:hypothetical protein